jgi:hypothetical protein
MPAVLLILYAGSPLNQASTASRFPAGKATLMRFSFSCKYGILCFK